uniref:Integrase catalytic domain-containing protein n=1 Tax=Tanacetum cinerariifolium TaxID=118510 RepID=A0A6L2JZ94_TANCI|nr:hypothetical protein [Tanacetum cinerariifolium]
MEWYRNLPIVLSVEDKLPFLEQPIPAMPVPAKGQVLPLDVLNTHTAWVKTSKEIAAGTSSVRLRIPHVQTGSMGKTVTELHAMLKLHEQTLPPKEVSPALHAMRGLRGSKKLKPGALSLYVGDGHRASVEAIGEFHLKMARKSYSHQVERAKDLLGLIHTDPLWLKHKHEVFETFKVFQKEEENQLGKTIKSLRSDRGGEYMSQEFLDHLKDHGIIAHRTLPYTSQMNRVYKRRNRTLLDMVRSMMSQTTIPKSFWDYAFEFAARILNMVPTKKVDKTPYKVWHGQALKLSYLKVWVCEALVKRDTLTKPDKLEPISIKYIFVGYPKETMGYSFYYPRENKVFVAWNTEFLTNSLIIKEASGSLEDLEIIQEEDKHPSLDTSLNHEEDD